MTRSCVARQEPYIPGALSILPGTVPGQVRGLGHMVPTYFRRELRDRALQRPSRLRTFLVRYDLLSSWPGIADRRTASLPLAYVPAIHVFSMRAKKDVDTRHTAGHDDNQCRASLLPWKHKKQCCAPQPLRDAMR